MHAKESSTKCLASPMFQNLTILVLPISIGQKRVALFESRIKKEGGTVCSLSEAKSGQAHPTHIVIEDSLIQNQSHFEKHIQTFKDKGVIIGTRWLSDCLKHRKRLSINDYQIHSSYFQGNVLASSSSESTPPKKQKLDNDLPLEDVSKPISSHEMVKINKFACSQSSSSINEAVQENQLIIQELQKLADAFRIRGDTWRAFGYTKAISAIKRCGKALSSYDDAVALPGVGAKMALKVWEILEMGCLRKVVEVCEDDKTRALELFNNIWGVGPSTAEGWFQQGCRTLDDVREKVTLTKQQHIGLRHYDDFRERIPRNEVEEVGKIVTAAANKIEPQLSSTLVGSYRRGKESSGDIDVMIIKPDNINSKDVLSQLIMSLKESGLITDDLVSMEKERNQRKYLGVCRLPGESNKFRRLDIFVVPKAESATALMHYTGSALFNRSIRLLAAKNGMSLSEHGLFGGIIREGLKVVNDGFPIPTTSEESIFEAMGLDYRAPEERDH